MSKPTVDTVLAKAVSEFLKTAGEVEFLEEES
jgi:hypothetical protein